MPILEEWKWIPHKNGCFSTEIKMDTILGRQNVGYFLGLLPSFRTCACSLCFLPWLATIFGKPFRQGPYRTRFIFSNYLLLQVMSLKSWTNSNILVMFRILKKKCNSIFVESIQWEDTFTVTFINLGFVTRWSIVFWLSHICFAPLLLYISFDFIPKATLADLHFRTFLTCTHQKIRNIQRKSRSQNVLVHSMIQKLQTPVHCVKHIWSRIFTSESHDKQ